MSTWKSPNIFFLTGIMFVLFFGFFSLGYQLGKATPCTDTEEFEIHPLTPGR